MKEGLGEWVSGCRGWWVWGEGSGYVVSVTTREPNV
jgi:hypothetical protein